MWWQAIVVALAGLCHITRAQVVTVDNNAYRGLVVSISENLNELLCDEYINGIKNMFTAGSELLYSATDNRLSFGEVTIVVPEAWACQDVVNSSNVAWDQAHFRVGPLHSVFGQNPWTQQPRGCGEPGDFMYFPEPFLLENSTLGSKGSVLVHEWAKYRWGVFEEYGHRADPIFPSATKSYDANETLRHTYCTDGEVKGNFYQCDGDNLDSCYFVPSADETTGVTSSLLATPFLSSVVNFCTSETHVADVPTKHNLLCEKRSTWDVIKDHSDITGTSPGVAVTPSFTVKRLTSQTTGNKLVFLLDVTAPMKVGADTWNYLRDAVRQFILSEATNGMQVGLVSFTDSATIISELVTLDGGNRGTLAEKVPNSPQDAQSKKVAEGISKAKQVLGAEGTVILVTENMKIHSEDLVAAADGTPVWPILYPHLIGVSYSNYQDLADAGGVSVFTIEDKVVDFEIISIQSVDNRVALTRFFLDIQYATQGISPQEIVSSSCFGYSCQMSLDVPANTNYEETFNIEIYFCYFDGTYLTATVRDPMGAVIGNSYNQDTNSLYRGTGLQAGTYTVEVSRQGNAMDVKSSLLATLQTESGGYAIKLWSSLDLQHLEYTSDSAPTLFAMVSEGDSHVVYASVTATVTDSGQNTAVLVMRDDGTGADVTGNDGVYSAYLIGLSQLGSASVQVSANDNGGLAKLVTGTTRTAPVDVNGQACCGSQITLQNDLPPTGTFTVTSDHVGEVTGTIPTNFPPGRVTDLRASLISSQVTLTFTAPGDELDQGTAARYDVNFKRGDNNNITTYSSNETQEAGSPVTINSQLPDCDVLFYITVSATGTQSGQGKESNEVRAIVSCSATEPPPTDPSNTSPLGAGAIVGIVIGVILFLVILAVVIYLVINRDNLDDLWLWQMITCRCLRKPKNENLYNPPAPRSTRSGNDVIRNNKSSSSGPVRNLDDLYTKPDLTAKRKKKADEDDGDGGFSEHRMRTNNTMAMNNLGDSASTASTPQPYMRQSNASINQVGLPPYSGEPNYGQVQNHGGSRNQYGDSQWDQQYYDQYGYGSQNDGYSNAGYSTDYYDNVRAPVPPRNTKSNTQV